MYTYMYLYMYILLCSECTIVQTCDLKLHSRRHYVYFHTFGYSFVLLYMYTYIYTRTHTHTYIYLVLRPLERCPTQAKMSVHHLMCVRGTVCCSVVQCVAVCYSL